MAHFISRRMNRVLPALALLHCLIWTWTCLAQTSQSAADKVRQAEEQAQRAVDEYAQGDEFKGLLAGWRADVIKELGLDPAVIPSAPPKTPEEIDGEIATAVSNAVEAKFPAEAIRQAEEEANQKYAEIKVGDVFEFGRHKGKVKSLNADRIVVGLASIPLDDLPKEVRVRMDPDKCAKLKERYVADKVGKERAAYGEAQRAKVREELYAQYGYVNLKGKIYSQHFLYHEVLPVAINKKTEAVLAAKKTEALAEATAKLGLTRLGDEWLTLRDAGQKLGDRSAALMNECIKYMRNADQGKYVSPSDIPAASKLADSLIQTASDFRQCGTDPDGSLSAQVMSVGIILKYWCRSSDYGKYEGQLAWLLQYSQGRNDSNPSRTTVNTEISVLQHYQCRLLDETIATTRAATAALNEVQEAEKTLTALLDDGKKLPKMEYTPLYDGDGNTRTSLEQSLDSFASSGRKSFSGTLKPTGYGVKLSYPDGTVEESDMSPSEFAPLRSRIDGYSKDLDQCEQKWKQAKARADEAARRMKSGDATGTLKQYEARLAFLCRLKDGMASGSVLPQATTEQR